MEWVIGTAVVIVVLLIILTIYFALRDKEKKMSGRSALEGEVGVARTDINPEGRVLVHGEWWNAKSKEPIPVNSKVRVVKAKGIVLEVEKVEE